MHMQVPHAAINGQSQKHAAKLAKTAASTIGSVQGLDTIKAGYMTTSDRQTEAGNGETDVNTMQKVDVDGQSGQVAAGVIPDALSKTSNPSTDALTEVKKKTRKGGRQRASNKKLAGEKASAAAPTSNINKQEVAPALTNTGSNTKRSTKKGKATQNTAHAQPNPPAAKTAGMQPKSMALTDASSCCSRCGACLASTECLVMQLACTCQCIHLDDDHMKDIHDSCDCKYCMGSGQATVRCVALCS